MRIVLVSTWSLSLAALLAACSSSSPEVMTHSEELAICLATDEPVSVPTFRDDLELPDLPGEPSPSPDDPAPSPGDDGEITARCCTAPDCTFHDYPPGTCTSVGTQPTSDEEVVVAETIRKRWNGPELRTMVIDGCETDDDGGDDPGDGPTDGDDDGGDDPGDCDGQIFYFHTGSETFDYVAWLEDFDTNGDGRPDHTDIVVGDARGIEPGARIRNPQGTEVFPLVRAGHPWQREDAMVLLPDGPDEDTDEEEYFLDEQNDCFRVDAVELECGTVYVCWIC